MQVLCSCAIICLSFISKVLIDEEADRIAKSVEIFDFLFFFSVLYLFMNCVCVCVCVLEWVFIYWYIYYLFI